MVEREAQKIDVHALVKRVIGHVMSERGRASHPTARPETSGVERLAGVFVTIEAGGEPLRPHPEKRESPRGRGAELVTAEMVAKVANGGTLRVPSGALVTDLARDEARKRGIKLTESATRDRGRLRIAVGADHGGFRMKQEVLDWVRALGHEAFDLGTHDENPVDYPDFARAVAEAVARDNADMGIVLDGAGIGSAIAANKVPGVRAATCWDAASAKNAREHNYANVLSFGAKMIASDKAREIVHAFLATSEGEERHGKRVKKIGDIERHYAR
jgi:ribose 5-phosphate isomerase B